MIKLILHLWSKLHANQSDGLGFEIQDVWKNAKEAFSFNGSYHDRLTPSQPNIVDIVMHDVNIKETKLETLILALSLF